MDREPMTVLLVDDNAELRATVAEQLAGLGHRVLEAGDGSAALARLRAGDPGREIDLLISDLRMPGIDGLTLIDHARAARPELPAVLISSHPDETLARRVEAGELAFCRKPFALAELEAAIEAARRLRPRAAGETAGAAPPDMTAERGRSNEAPPPTRRAAGWLGAAAALLIAVGVASLAGRGEAPLPSPAVGTDEVTRSYRVTPRAPQGTLERAPARLDWRPVTGAAAYHLELLRMDREPVWQGQVAAPPADLPAAVVAALERAVLYTWRVEAVDDAGRRLAWSEHVRFHIAPENEATAPGAPP